MAPCMPENPNLERFRRDARRLQAGVRAGDAEALDLVARLDRQPKDPSTFTLAMAQLVVARAYDFPSWPKLRKHLAVVQLIGRDPTRVEPESNADRFCALACLVYSDLDHPQRPAAAIQLLAQDPALARSSVYAASVAGDAEGLDQLLEDPNVLGGPFDWPPLMYLTYSRIPQRDVLASAQLLLDAGADPNWGYLWQGLTPPFTVLTGVFGEGEQGRARQPRHREEQALAKLLLSRGAEANDGQTLYNRMFGRDDAHLRLLFAHGLGAGDGGPWVRRLGDAIESVTQMMDGQLSYAVEQGYDARLALLAENGWTSTEISEAPIMHRAGTPDEVTAAARAGGDLNALWEGRTALHQAAYHGDVALAQALLDAGADPTIVDENHESTPLGWAEHGLMAEVADLLRQRMGQGGT